MRQMYDLVKIKPLTAHEIAEEMGMDRAVVYLYLRYMTDENAIIKTKQSAGYKIHVFSVPEGSELPPLLRINIHTTDEHADMRRLHEESKQIKPVHDPLLFILFRRTPSPD